MTKRLEITPKIAAAISKSTDGGVDPNTVAVFEWVALTTLPLNKRGTLFDQGRVTESTLQEMAAHLNAGNFVPLHTLHQQGYELPVGRVFAGEFVNEGGVGQLRVLLYVSLSEDALLGKLDSGAIDEVSVGLRSKHLTCSECGFDYLGETATFENLWSQTCPDGHTIAKNGVYANISGMDRFLELSFVSLGAAQGAKSVSREKSLLSEADYKQILQASGHDPIKSLFASPTHPTSKKEPEMDLTVLVQDLTTAKANLGLTEQKLTAAEGSVVSLKAEKEALAKQVTDLSAEVTSLKAGDAAKLKEDLTAANTARDEALAFVRAEATRLAVAASTEKPADTADLAALKASIEASRTKLAATLPPGGASRGADAGDGEKADTRAQSFKTSR